MPDQQRQRVEHEWGVFRAHVRCPTSEDAVQDRFTTIRRGSGKTTSRCRRDAVAAAISLRIRRFAGRLAKPFAGEKPPTPGARALKLDQYRLMSRSPQDEVVILQIEYSECDRRAAIFRTNDFANHPSGASPKRGHTGAIWTNGEAALLLRPPASGERSGQSGSMSGWQRREEENGFTPIQTPFVYTLRQIFTGISVSAAEDVLADPFDLRSAPDPGRGGRVRIEVVQGTV
ncbi:MAG: hypothetical protein H0Z34_05625 [Brevibacillus sp.]|nr:hypothetical protein [Brevibacillus sp.]